MTRRAFYFSRWVAAAALILLFTAVPLAYGQASTFARLVGTVTDQSGGVVPGAEVTIVNEATNVPKKTLTDVRGDYLIDNLQPGLYTVSTELQGFKKKVFTAVRLETGQFGRVDFVLEPGGISETVTVKAQASLIDTQKAEIGAVVESQAIRELPLAGRDITKLAYLVTGGVAEAQTVAEATTGYGGGMPAFNGLYSSSNQVTLDGSNNQGYIAQRMTVSPTPDTVQEFKVITNNYSAEFGRVGGAVVQITSKSGTNSFRGDGWFYIRNDTMDANNFFNNRSGLGKLPVDYKIFGGDVGGPIKKDRTFFFGNFERFIDDRAITSYTTVPSAKRRAGDFSDADGPYVQAQLYDPFTIVNGDRAAFTGNSVPQSRWSPVSKKLLELLPPPLPNQSGKNSNNFAYPSTTTKRVTKWSARIDHNLSAGSTLFGRFSWQDTPERYHSGAVGSPGMLYGMYENYRDLSKGWQLASGWVKPIRSDMVSELNVALWRFDWTAVAPLDSETKNWEKDIGFDTTDRTPVFNPDGTRGVGGMPRVGVSGYLGWAGAEVQHPTDWGIDGKYSLAWKKGPHYLKFGVGHIRNFNVGYLRVVQGVGSSSFNGYQTGQITRNAAGAITGATFGDPFADFLLGAPASFSGNIYNTTGYGQGGEGRFNQSSYSWFVQDDWRISRDMTVNLGIRWEQPRPPVYSGSRSGEYKEDFYYCAIDYSGGRWDPPATFPENMDIKKWAGGDLSKTSIPYKNLSSRTCYPARYMYFSPRVGLAWKVMGSNRTVLRVGGGSSTDSEFGILRARPFVGAEGTVSATQTRGGTQSLIFGQFRNLPTVAATAEYTLDYHTQLDWQEGTVYSYNLGIQHELAPSAKLEISYVGNQGRHIREISPWNVANPDGYQGVTLITGQPLVTSSNAVTHPTKNVTFSGQKARRPYPQVIPNVMQHDMGSMNYNSLQVRFDRRFQGGLGITAGYTWSKVMALNYNGMWGDFSGGSRWYERWNLKGPMYHDRTQAFYSAILWELPFFRNAGGLKQAVLGGWEVDNITTLMSGIPYTVQVGQDLFDQGTRYNLYPDRIGSGYLPDGQRSVEKWFDYAAFILPKAGTLGNSNNRPLRGDGIPLTDFSFHKQFVFKERNRIDVRADFFNAFNHAIFNAPNGSITSTAVGTVTSAASPRQIQLGVRYSF